jgi:hypothetical protein
MVRKKTRTSRSASKRPTLREQDQLRGRFRTLLLQNPNYFGNLQDSVFDPVLTFNGSKSYESLGCVGYNPDLERLHAVVYINRRTGYGGQICSNGSTEYVRFYLSFDGGATWEDQGLSSFKAYDIPQNETRLEYAVTRRVKPARKFCFFPNLIQARAILSWNAIPPANQPDFKPVWGDVHDTHIEVDPFRWIVIGDLLKAVKIDVPDLLLQAVDLDQTVQAKKNILTVAEKAELYRDTKVEPHRFALAELQAKADNPVLTANLQTAEFLEIFPDLNIDLTGLGDLLAPQDGSVFYEELECVGFDARTDTLVGILRIKRPNGYSGGPCTVGSSQYVTFWGDFNDNGTFETCLGTASVNVHDYQEIPREGLEYSVFLKVDLGKFQQPCEEGARLIPIRAILSWAVPAPCANPNYVPVWGNREETIIHLPAGPSIQGKLPVVVTVGDMAIPDIGPAGLATGTGVETFFSAENSPFGGRIDITGKIANGDSASKYRVSVKPHGAPDTAYVPITNEPTGLKLTLVTVVIPPPPAPPVITIDTDHTVHADGLGYYPYEDYSSSHFIEGNLLMRWFTGPAEHGLTFDLRVDLSVDGNPANDSHSDVVTVRVDNESPKATLDINLGGGVECADFDLGATFTGNFSATDEHFRRFYFQILPPGPADGVLPVPPNGLSVFLAGGTIADPGVAAGIYTLNTDPPGPAGPMAPCGYSLTIWAESRTNVNSGTSRRRTPASVGFCLRAP